MRKNLFKTLGLVLVLFGLAPVAQANSPSELSNAIGLYMNGDFTQALSQIEAYIGTHPNEATGYLVRGMCREWEQMSLNKKNDGLSLADYQKANGLAQLALEKNPGDWDAKILLGNTFMYVAKKQIDSGSKLTGGGTLKKSQGLMNEAITQNPNAFDAYLALGIFNYFSENIPSGFKWLAMLIGFKGDAAKGITYINKAASSPNLTQGDAEFMQLYIAHKKKDYPRALQVSESLSSKYPGNLKFLNYLIQYQQRNKAYAASRESFTKYAALCQSAGPCNKENDFLANFFVAWGYMEEKNYQEAKPYVLTAVRLNPGKFKDRNVYMDFWQGVVAKSDGKNDEAKSFLQKAASGSKHAPEISKMAKEELATLR
jgi:tetratricopeptide (TPR) repeat protein